MVNLVKHLVVYPHYLGSHKSLKTFRHCCMQLFNSAGDYCTVSTIVTIQTDISVRKCMGGMVMSSTL